MQQNHFINDAKTNRSINIPHMLGYREDGMMYFNSAILTAARSDGIPDLEKLNFATIAYKNMMEVAGRDLGNIDNGHLGRLITILISFVHEINNFVQTVNLDALKSSIRNDLPAPVFAAGNQREYQQVLQLTPVPQIIAYPETALKNYWFEGMREFPITFFRDFTYEYDINNIGMQFESKLRDEIHEMETRKIRIVLVWVNSKLTAEDLHKLRIIFRKIALFPIFMNVDLLNAMNSWGLEDEWRLKWPMAKIRYEKKDFLKPGMLPVYIRVPDESFDEIIDFYHQASESPEVKSIYIALYRAIPDGELIKTLIKASKNGKDVRVYTEETARGDELSNFQIAQKLRTNGDPEHMIVSSSYNGLKVHAKMGLVVLNDGRMIAHMGTGNFNEDTARVYTDIHMISDDPEDVDQVVGAFTALGQNIPFRQTIRDVLLDEIRGQAALGIDGRIILKCNHAIDDDIRYELKLASQCGCTIKMCTRTSIGIDGGMTGAEVESILGRYLEHERIYAFGQGDAINVYLSSSDLMFRNLYKRMEVIFKVRDPILIWELLQQIFFE